MYIYGSVAFRWIEVLRLFNLVNIFPIILLVGARFSIIANHLNVRSCKSYDPKYGGMIIS